MNKSKRNNITIRIVSVLIAVIMWTYVMNEVNPRTTQYFHGIKVNYLNQNYLSESALQIMEPEEAKVTVELAGRRSDVKAINPNDIIVQADLWGVSEGMNRVTVEVNPPENVSVESVNPQYIQFRLDSIITKEFKISLRTTGKPADGFTQEAGEIKPSSVLIKGPRTWVNSISSVVASVDLSKASSDIKTNVPVRVFNDKGEEVRGIVKEPGTVDISVPILATKTVKVNPRLKGTPQEGHTITGVEIEPVNVMVKGRTDILNDIEFLETESIDVENISMSKQVPIGVSLPEGVELLDRETVLLAKIQVEKIIEKDIELSTEDLTYINLDTRLTVDKTNLLENLTITVRGVESIVEALNQDNITFYSDLSGLESGTHSINMKFILPNDIELIQVVPETIDITIQEEEF